MSRTLASALAALLLLASAGVAWTSCSESTAALTLRHRTQSWLKSRSVVTTIDVEGVGSFKMFLNPDDIALTPVLWAGQLWETNETYWFLRSVRPGDVVVDVGANVGYYTLLAGMVVGEEGRVYAFEPDPVGFALLQRNVRLNGLDNVVVEQKAVSSQAGSIQLFVADTNKGDHRIYQPEGEERPSIEIEAVSLDDYFEGVEETVDFVKVDTQGAEGAILEGMMGLLARSPQAVMAFEYSPRHLAGFGSTAEDLLARIGSLDLRMFSLGPGGGRVRRLQPVSAEQLLAEFSPDRRDFTNLMLLPRGAAPGRAAAAPLEGR